MKEINEKIRLVMLDVDGTIIDSPRSCAVSEELCEIVKEIAGTGVYIGLASGRCYGHIMSQMKSVGFTGPYICNGGALVVYGEKIHYEYLLPDKVIAAAWEQIRTIGCYAEFQGRKQMYVYISPKYKGPVFPKVGDDDYLYNISYDDEGYEKIRNESISKITIAVDTEEKAEKVAEFWEKGELKKEVLFTRSFWFSMELTLTHINKGTALFNVAKLLDIPLSEVLAIGDGDNDVEMLEAAGVSFAMGNASEAATRAAKYRTASVAEKGAEKVLSRYLVDINKK